MCFLFAWRIQFGVSLLLFYNISTKSIQACCYLRSELFNGWTRCVSGVGALGDSVFSALFLECPVPRICSFVSFWNVWAYASMFRAKDHEGIFPPEHRQILRHQSCTYQWKSFLTKPHLFWKTLYESIYIYILNQRSEYKVFCKLVGWLWVKLVDVLEWWGSLQRGDLVHRITGQMAESV
jgi:hypothetical protein